MFTEQERLALLKVIFEHQFDYDDDVEALKSAQEKARTRAASCSIGIFPAKAFRLAVAEG